MERRIEAERPKMRGWYPDQAYNTAYFKSQLRFIKHGVAIALGWAVISVFYLGLSIYDYYSGNDGLKLFVLHLLVGLGWGACAVLYYYSVKTARANANSSGST